MDGFTQDSLIPIHAAARRLGVSIGTVRRYIRDGDLPATLTVGGHHRIAVTDIEELLERGRREVELRSVRA